MEPTILLADPGMVLVFVVVVLVEVLSLIWMGLTAYEYNRTLRGHADFFVAVGEDDRHKLLEHSSRVLLWIYIITTILATLVTGYVFIFQPHLL